MKETTTRYLELARRVLGMDVAYLSEYNGSQQIMRAVNGEASAFSLREGDSSSWESSFCTRVVDGRMPNVIRDAKKNPATAELPGVDRLGIGSYAGAPVRRSDGSLFGMLCCIGRGPNEGLTEADGRILEALAASLGEEIADEEEGGRAARVDRIRRVLGGEGLRMAVQPIVSLTTMEAVGVEALARFDVPPSRPDVWFAEAAELGMGSSLELAAIRTALRHLDELPPDLYVSVNAGPESISSDELLEAVRAVDARRVVVELTEHSSVGDYDLLLASLAKLRSAGVRIAIDDAGAGYASFRHILRLRPDIVKFDRNLVTGLDSDPARKALVRALVGFAQELGATVVAEGIETASELDALSRLGVACGQGYCLARPGSLPLPPITAAPSSRETRRDPTESDSRAFPELVQAVLRQVVERTGLEASYVTVRDAEADSAEHRYVYDPEGIGIPEGLTVEWNRTLCYRCREAGILWTADVQTDLARGTIAEGTEARSFLSVPLTDLNGTLLGTLCGLSRERRYLSDPVVQEVENLALSVVSGLVRERERYRRGGF